MIGRSTGGRGPGIAYRAALLTIAAVLVAGCASSTPSPSVPGPSAAQDSPAVSIPPKASPAIASPSAGVSGDLETNVLAAAGDPSAVRMTSVERDFLAQLDRLSGYSEAIGPELEAWRIEQRSVAVTAALEAAGIDTSTVGPTAISTRPVAALGDGLTAAGLAWIGSSLGSALALNAGISGISPSANGQAGPPANFTATDTVTVGDQQMTATFNVNVALSISGSLVVVDADATESDVSTSVSSGSQIGTANHRSHIHIEAKACPDANGVVEVKITFDISTDASGMPGGGSATVTSTTTQQGHVNDAAYLASADSTIDAQFTRTTASGSTQSGSSTFTNSQVFGANGTGVTSGAAAPSLNITGNFDVGEATGFLSFVMLTATMVTGQALDAAQTQWRNGKCVAIRSSEHTRDVGPNDVVHFNAQPFQRIEHVDLNQPVVASFAGETSLDPVDTPVPAPADFTFKASARETSGRIELKTTSKRGIGILPIAFTVKFQGWFIQQSFTNSVGVTGTIEGKRCGDDPETTWEAKGTYHFLVFDGKQAWKIDINDKGFVGNDLIWTGPYTYRDDSTGPYGVKQHTRVSGTVKMIISDADGSATMTFTEGSRRQWATAPHGGIRPGPARPRSRSSRTWSGRATPTADADLAGRASMTTCPGERPA